MISFALSAGILWLLLIVFHEGSSFDALEERTFVIIFAVCVVGRIAELLLPVGYGFASVLFQVVVLYFLIDKLCGYSIRTICKIMISFLGAHVILSMIISSLIQ